MSSIVIHTGLEAVSTRADGSIKLTFSTPELSPENCTKLFLLRRKECLLYLTTGEVNEKQIQALNNAATNLKKMPAKSHSQRLRAVLYRLWEQSETALTAEEFYKDRIEMIIEHFKEKLD